MTGKIILRRVAIAACLIMGAFVAAAGQNKDQNWRSCRDGKVDTRILSCTALIESGKEAPAHLAEAYDNRARAYNEKGDIERAIRDDGEALRILRDYIATSTDSAFQNWQKGAYDQAIQECDEALRLDPNNVEALNTRGMAYQEKGQYDRAIEDYDAAERIDPQNSETPINRGFTYLRMEKYTRAIEAFNQAIQLSPGGFGGFLGRGIAYGHKGEFDRAIEDYDQVIRISPQTQLAFILRGNAFKHKGQYDRAIADENEAILLSPDDPLAFEGRGNAYFDQRKYDLAEADYDQSIRLDPTERSFFNNRGNVYKLKGKRELALLDYNEAIRLDPAYAGAYLNRGNLYQFQGDFDHGIADLTRAIELEPDFVEAITDLAVAYHRSGQGDRAIQELRRAIDVHEKLKQSEVRQKPTDAYYFLGLAMLGIGQYDQAIDAFDRGIAEDPKSMESFWGRGRAHYYKGAFDLAKSDFEQSQELEPTDPRPLFWLHLANKQLGEDDGANFARRAAKIDDSKWPAPLVKFYLGEITSSSLEAAAEDPDPVQQKSHLCDVNFYVGEDAALGAFPARAKVRFLAARDGCSPDLNEYEGAVAELRRIEAESQKPE